MTQQVMFELLKANVPSVSGRIYPATLPEKPTLPAMTFTRISRVQEPTLDTSGMQRVRIQFNFFGRTAYDAAECAAEVELFFNGFSAVLSDGTWLQNAWLITDSDTYEDVARERHVQADYYLLYTLARVQ